jgi:hypothetical protein
MTVFPVCFVSNGAVTDVFTFARGFSSQDESQHPAEAWSFWDDDDWAEKLPNVLILPLVDVNPATDGQVGTRNDPSTWTVQETQVIATYTVRSMTADEIATRDAPAIRREFEARIKRESDDLRGQGKAAEALLLLYDNGLLYATPA